MQKNPKNKTLLLIGVILIVGVLLFVTSVTIAYESYNQLTQRP